MTGATEKDRPLTAAPPDRAGLSGLEYVQALRDGKIPPSPMANTIGYRVIEVEQGAATLAVTPGKHLSNNITLHGGAMATLLDGAMSSAVNSALPKGARCKTLELKVNYLDAPTLESGRLFGKGRVIQLRHRTGLAEGKIEDANGKLYAHATATFSIRRPQE